MSTFSSSSQQAKKVMISRSIIMLTLLLTISAIFGVIVLKLFNLEINFLDFVASWILVASAYATIDLVLTSVNKFYEYLLKDL